MRPADTAQGTGRGTGHATLAIVDRDPAVVGLGVLLDDDVLSGWLSERLGHQVRARRTYLRYKHGTSAVAAVAWTRPGAPLVQGHRVAVVSAYSAGAAAKAHKLLLNAPPGSVLTSDPSLRMVAVLPEADRALPALARLADPRRRERLLGQPGAELTRLAYKPHRRWVGRLDGPAGRSLLRVYRPADLATALRPLTALAQATGAAPVPSVLDVRRRHGVLRLDHAPGRPALDHGWEAAGAALAALHGCPTDLPPLEDSRTLRQAAAQVALLLPSEADRAAVLVDRLRDRPSGPAAATLHGDFSLDQVVVDGRDRAALIDLDRAGVGAPEVDLGSLVASTLADQQRVGQARTVLAGVVAGYTDGARAAAPDDEAVARHAAASLLRRAGEPFRHGHPEWAAETTRYLAAADTLLEDGLR